MTEEHSTKPSQSPDAGALYQLAYQESQRSLTQQASVLDNLRTRAGLVITAANVVTALLGAPAIKNATSPSAGGTDVPGLTLGGLLAVVCFGIVGVASILMLWPWKGWTFRFGAKDIVRRVDERPDITLAGTHRRLAELNEESFLANETKLSRLFWLLEVAAIFLFLESVFWVASLAPVRIPVVPL